MNDGNNNNGSIINKKKYLNDLHNIRKYVTLRFFFFFFFFFYRFFELANENQGDIYLCQLSLLVITGYQFRQKREKSHLNL